MGIVCTNTWPGTGALWTAAGNNSSDGSAWTQTTSLLGAWTTLTTSASGNVGTFTALQGATGAAGVWRTGASSPNDAHAHAVFSMSSGQTTASRLQGIILNKTATTANTFYLATFNVSGAKGSNVYGLELRRYNAGALTTLFSPYATISGLNGSTAKWIIQFRVTRIDGGASVLLQARAWQGTNPASPPTGCDWIMSGGITGTGYQSIAVTDTSPLAAGRGGIFLQSANVGTTFTGTYEQFEFRQLSAQTVTATNAQTVATTKSVAKPVTTTALASAVTSIRNALRTATATVTSNVLTSRAVAATRSAVASLTSLTSRITSITNSTTLTTNATSIRNVARQTLTTLSSTVTSARQLAINVTQTLTTTASNATARALTIAVTIGSTVTTSARRLIPEPPRIIQLGQRTTSRLAQTVSTRLPGRSTLRWAQTTVTRLTGRNVLRLPKE